MVRSSAVASVVQRPFFGVVRVTQRNVWFVTYKDYVARAMGPPKAQKLLLHGLFCDT